MGQQGEGWAGWPRCRPAGYTHSVMPTHIAVGGVVHQCDVDGHPALGDAGERGVRRRMGEMRRDGAEERDVRSRYITGGEGEG
jgi:hypothetical protein